MSIAVKVCGMKEPENIREVAGLPVDMLGFIFHAPSPRYAGALDPAVAGTLPGEIRKVGVFVNPDRETALGVARQYGLSAIQLHGEESPDECRFYRSRGLLVIKAIPVGEHSPTALATPYARACDYLLFDSRAPGRGGSGKQFDWRLLDDYAGPLPFILSGGIGPEDAGRIRTRAHPLLRAVDLNSRFETQPGIKDPRAVQQFIQELNN